MSSYTDRVWEDTLQLGRANQVTVELARRHCLNMIFTECGGRGMADGNLAAACSYATQAAELLQYAAFAVGTARLRAFRTATHQPLNGGSLQAIDEYLTRTAA